MFSSVLPRLVLSIACISSSISVDENEISRGERAIPIPAAAAAGRDAARRSARRAPRAGGAGSWISSWCRRASCSCRVTLALVLAALVGGEPVVERLQADAEHVGRLALRAALGEGGLDQAPAHL